MRKKACDDETLDDAIYEAIQDKAWRTRSMGSALRIVTKYLDFNKALESYIDLHRVLLPSARE